MKRKKFVEVAESLVADEKRGEYGDKNPTDCKSGALAVENYIPAEQTSESKLYYGRQEWRGHYPRAPAQDARKNHIEKQDADARNREIRKKQDV